MFQNNLFNELESLILDNYYGRVSFSRLTSVDKKIIKNFNRKDEFKRVKEDLDPCNGFGNW